MIEYLSNLIYSIQKKNLPDENILSESFTPRDPFLQIRRGGVSDAATRHLAGAPQNNIFQWRDFNLEMRLPEALRRPRPQQCIIVKG